MRSLSSLVMILGCAAMFGCGDNNLDVETSVNGVFPSAGMLDRTVRVEVTGDETTWADGTTVTFGDGITVGPVSVASPTDIFVDVTMTGSAALGLRDVTVTDTAGKALTLSKAFEVDASATFSITSGSAAQGTIATFSIQNNDFTQPFDTTADPNSGELLNLAITGPDGTTFLPQAATQYQITGTVLFDMDAAAGSVQVMSGPSGGTVVNSDFGTPLAVATTTPMALTSGTKATGNEVNPGDCHVFTLTGGTTAEVAQFTTTGDDPSSGDPSIFILAASGKWSDQYVTQDAILPTGGMVYAVIADLNGDTGYTYSITGTNIALTSTAADTEPANSDPATATAVTAPVLISGASLADDTDVDWFKVVVATTGAGAKKTIHVITGGDPATDTVISGWSSLVDAQAASSTNELFGDADATTQEDVSASVVAGTYYIQISASQDFDPTHNTYIAAIYVE